MKKNKSFSLFNQKFKNNHIKLSDLALKHINNPTSYLISLKKENNNKYIQIIPYNQLFEGIKTSYTKDGIFIPKHYAKICNISETYTSLYVGNSFEIWDSKTIDTYLNIIKNRSYKWPYNIF
jgi:hypothetical protein